MTYKTILLCLLGVLLTLSTAVAQMMHIHTSDGETISINLAEIDSLTFSEGDDEAPRPGEERVFELIQGVEIIMCWIPAGSFMMGAQDDEQDAGENEYPRHRVTFENGFWMGKYEVTQAQWEAVTDSNWSRYEGENHPVELISWDDIYEEFLTQINENFRLPSEAEWEYACRAGVENRFFWGNDGNYDEIGDYAWYLSNSNTQTHEVGQKRPNAFGLYDMSGNIHEWCEDWYHDSYEGSPEDGSAWDDNGGYRVLRGGSFNYNPRYSRSANRHWSNPGVRFAYCGFRLVRDAG